jgi:hypothetical protein
MAILARNPLSEILDQYPLPSSGPPLPPNSINSRGSILTVGDRGVQEWNAVPKSGCGQACSLAPRTNDYPPTCSSCNYIWVGSGTKSGRGRGSVDIVMIVV